MRASRPIAARTRFQLWPFSPLWRNSIVIGVLNAPCQYNCCVMHQEQSALARRWRNTPNAISITRICATSVLLASVWFERVDLFKWLLLACLLSDILDGLIARAFHLTSKLGATLDSIADILTMLIGLVGVVVFQKQFVAD